MELDRAKFRRWLEGMPPETDCGRAHYITLCPLAIYLTEHTDASYRVTADFITEVHPSEIRDHPTPSWASRFITRVDQDTGPVLARNALAILDGIDDEDRA